MGDFSYKGYKRILHICELLILKHVTSVYFQKYKEKDKHKQKHKKQPEPSPALVPSLTVTTEKVRLKYQILFYVINEILVFNFQGVFLFPVLWLQFCPPFYPCMHLELSFSLSFMPFSVYSVLVFKDRVRITNEWHCLN